MKVFNDTFDAILKTLNMIMDRNLEEMHICRSKNKNDRYVCSFKAELLELKIPSMILAFLTISGPLFNNKHDFGKRTQHLSESSSSSDSLQGYSKWCFKDKCNRTPVTLLLLQSAFNMTFGFSNKKNLWGDVLYEAVTSDVFFNELLLQCTLSCSDQSRTQHIIDEDLTEGGSKFLFNVVEKVFDILSLRWTKIPRNWYVKDNCCNRDVDNSANIISRAWRYHVAKKRLQEKREIKIQGAGKKILEALRKCVIQRRCMGTQNADKGVTLGCSSGTDTGVGAGAGASPSSPADSTNFNLGDDPNQIGGSELHGGIQGDSTTQEDIQDTRNLQEVFFGQKDDGVGQTFASGDADSSKNFELMMETDENSEDGDEENNLSKDIIAEEISYFDSIPPKFEEVVGMFLPVLKNMNGIGDCKAGQSCNPGSHYGELSLESFDEVIHTVIDKGYLTDKSKFIDVGSGNGWPCILLSYVYKIACHGMEVVSFRNYVSQNLLYSVCKQLENLEKAPKCSFSITDLHNLISFDPFDFIYILSAG